jgi:DDE superfamily endonuclease
MTIDGTDFQIQEPIPFSNKWYSHKFGGPALRYELGVAISTGDIVWFNGPFPAGRFNDLRIFRHSLKGYLDPGEKVVADRGYLGDPQIYTPDYPRNSAHKLTMRRARARHESVNRNLKKWKSLKHVFRHSRNKHGIVFQSVVVLTQIMTENGRPPFQVRNVHDPVFDT